MKANKNHNHSHFSVRRIILSESSFTCGMCREQYQSIGEAQRCLKLCIREQILSTAVERVRHLGQLRFRCGICRRMHHDHPDAEKCSSACKAKLIEQASLEELDGLELKHPVSNRQKYVSRPKPVKVKLIPPYRLRRLMSDSDVDKEIDEATQNGEGADSENNNKPKPQKEPTIKRKADLKDKFIRQGAEYQCSFCLKLYYTKVEVNACFEAHPDEEVINP